MAEDPKSKEMLKQNVGSGGRGGSGSGATESGVGVADLFKAVIGKGDLAVRHGVSPVRASKNRVIFPRTGYSSESYPKSEIIYKDGKYVVRDYEGERVYNTLDTALRKLTLSDYGMEKFGHLAADKPEQKAEGGAVVNNRLDKTSRRAKGH